MLKEDIRLIDYTISASLHTVGEIVAWERIKAALSGHILPDKAEPTLPDGLSVTEDMCGGDCKSSQKPSEPVQPTQLKIEPVCATCGRSNRTCLLNLGSNACRTVYFENWPHDSIGLPCSEHGIGKKCIMRGCHLTCGSVPCSIVRQHQ